MTRDLPFAPCKDANMKNTQCLHCNDMKFIMKPIQVIHQPTLEILYKNNQK